MSEQNNVLLRIMNFQQEMEDIEILKLTEAYGYYYATLHDILKVIHPILRKHSIWYQHYTDYDIDGDTRTLITFIYLTEDPNQRIVSTSKLDTDVILAKMNKFMVEGSAITYFRRYHLTTLLGLNTDEDTDAGGKRVTKKPGGKGRSVEASTSTTEVPNFVEIFKSQAKNKTKEQFQKTFEMYKSQMPEDQAKEVAQLFKDTYE